MQVLSEVRNPQRTLRIALPLSMGAISVLYLLANVAYVSQHPPWPPPFYSSVNVESVRRCAQRGIQDSEGHRRSQSLQEHLRRQSWSSSFASPSRALSTRPPVGDSLHSS